MTRLAQLVFYTLIAWLLFRDVRQRPAVSAATWLAVLWAAVLSTRPVSNWFTSGMTASTSAAYLEGSPVDRATFIVLIAAGVLVLVRRKVSFADAVRSNPWLFAFYAYFLVSIVWSDYPFVAFKRWFRECGNLVMVLLVMTERDPVDAVKAVFVRTAYFLVPLSVLFVRYMPDIGRAYAGYSANELMYVGVTTHKNSLGGLLVVASVCLVWSLMDPSRRTAVRRDRFWWFDSTLVLMMALWLLLIANSATSLVCSVLGVTLLLAMRMDTVRGSVRYTELLALGLGALWLLVDPLLNISESAVGLLGRDMTLTSRTGAWDLVLHMDANPLFGAGFKSFWAGDRMAKLWVDLPGIVQAHNGYIETYLEGGILGVVLLAVLFVVALQSIKRGVLAGDEFARVRFTFVIVALFYNFSEAAITQRTLIWLMTMGGLVEPLGTVTAGVPRRVPWRRSAAAGSPPPLGAVAAPTGPERSRRERPRPKGFARLVRGRP